MNLRLLQVILFVSMLLPVGLQANENEIERLIVFGDSLSDPGNFFLATGDSVAEPFEPIPTAPYEVGKFHFSNGETWVERLARELENRRGGRPALERPGRFTNYAFGRARARPSSPVFSDFDLSFQVSAFLFDFESVAPSDALYSVWIGSNDLFEAINALQDDPSGVSTATIITEAITATSENIFALYVAGARTFLVPNMPNAAITPAVISQNDPTVTFVANLVTGQYNAALAAALDGLEAGLLGIRFIRLDVFSILNGIVESPAAVGLENVTNSCITPGIPEDAICGRPNKFLFWDFIHPTRRAHRILSERAVDVLEENLFEH